jgi:heme/copper-type cytochrome/quinol oxidase subunit 2
MSRGAIRNVILILVLLVILVALFLVLRPSSTQDSSTTAESTTSAQPPEANIDLAIQGGTMTPDEVSVTEGDEVNFRITSDHPVEFHLHGYDLEEEVEPGEPTELSFEATMTGRFAIEDHDTDTELGALLVQPS